MNKNKFHDFKALNEKILLNAENFVENLIPKGKKSRNEWIALNPTRDDKNMGSFRINLISGKWADFATGDKGSDLISLYAYIKKCSQYEAFKKIGGIA